MSAPASAAQFCNSAAGAAAASRAEPSKLAKFGAVAQQGENARKSSGTANPKTAKR